MFLLALSAAILYALVSIFSETDVETYRWRIFAVAIGTVAVEFALTKVLSGLIWDIVIMLMSVLIVCLGLVYWCKTPRKQALKIAGIYALIRLGLAVGLFFLFRRV